MKKPPAEGMSEAAHESLMSVAEGDAGRFSHHPGTAIRRGSLLGFLFAAQAAPERFLAGVHAAALVGAACAILAAGCVAWGLRRP